MFCFHKYGEIKEGYQYCLKCGEAIPVPCPHKWEIIQSNSIIRTDYLSRVKCVTGKVFIIRCTKCGEIETRNVDYWVHFATSEANHRRKIYKGLSGSNCEVELTKEEKEIDAFDTAKRHIELMRELEDKKHALLVEK